MFAGFLGFAAAAEQGREEAAADQQRAGLEKISSRVIE
jgi:hypothetical protein